MTAPERNELRRRIDAEKRRRIQARCNGETGRFYDNPETGARNGCHCDYCRLGALDAGRARRRRRRRRLEEVAA